MKKVLLHICCGVCAFHCIEKLRQAGYFVDGLFFNPNIYPAEEYSKRKEAAQKVADLIDIKMVEGGYDPALWLSICGEYKDDPEGGRRCFLCYETRLKECK